MTSPFSPVVSALTPTVGFHLYTVWVVGSDTSTVTGFSTTTVNPGFGGQSFIYETLPKIQQAFEWRQSKGLRFRIGVDGGVDFKKQAIYGYGGGSPRTNFVRDYKNVVREFRDLAVLLSVMHGLPDGDPKIAIERLQRLTESGNPWRASALELTAAAKLKAGDRSGALEIYKTLADDLTAPQRLRARAAEMAAALAP